MRRVDMMRQAIALLAFASLVGLLASCSTSRRKPVYPVHGQVMFKGKPANEMFVYFRPTDANDPDPIIAYGQVDATGQFTLSTYTARDGAPAGEYVVTFEWPEQGGPTKLDFQGPDRLKGRYKDAKASKFHIRIEKKPNEVGPFELD